MNFNSIVTIIGIIIMIYVWIKATPIIKQINKDKRKIEAFENRNTET